MYSFANCKFEDNEDTLYLEENLENYSYFCEKISIGGYIEISKSGLNLNRKIFSKLVDLDEFEKQEFDLETVKVLVNHKFWEELKKNPRLWFTTKVYPRESKEFLKTLHTPQGCPIDRERQLLIQPRSFCENGHELQLRFLELLQWTRVYPNCGKCSESRASCFLTCSKRCFMKTICWNCAYIFFPSKNKIEENLRRLTQKSRVEKFVSRQKKKEVYFEQKLRFNEFQFPLFQNKNPIIQSLVF